MEENRYAARLGIALLVLPARRPVDGSPPEHVSLGEVYPKVLASLREDPRVKELKAPTPEKNETRGRWFASAGKYEKGEPNGTPAMPHQHLHGAVFDEPITMLIQVPKRLQPQGRGIEAIPAEEYWAAWDGVQVLVMWPFVAGSRPFGYFGGFAVLDVIEKAAGAAGYRLSVQPCGSSCNYPFAHQDLLVQADPSSTEMVLEEEDDWTTRVVCPPSDSPMRLVRNLATRLSYTAHIFASLRSHGASIEGTERLARRDLGALLQLQYESAEIAAKPLLKSLRLRWRRRSLSREMARLTASLWLRLAALEENQWHWADDKYLYDRDSARRGYGRIFSVEYPQEVNSVGSLDVSSLRAAVQQMSTRADSRLLVVATAGGALAGALVGGLVGLLR